MPPPSTRVTMSQATTTIAKPNLNSVPNNIISTTHGKPPAPLSKKRKRDDDTQGLPQLKRFVIKPCPASIHDKPYTLKPLRLLERWRLPLSFLDPAPGNSQLPATRLFSASIDALETRPNSGNFEQESTKALVASLEPSSSLYAVERVKTGIYALCKLCDWVSVEHLDGSLGASYTPIPRQPLAACPNANTGEWWKMAAVGVDLTLLKKPTKRLRLSMAPPPVVIDQPLPEAPAAVTTMAVLNSSPPTNLDSVPESPPTSQEVIEKLVQGYLEALYKSRTSLAFFAKGPLSRAVASCESDVQDKLSLPQLTAYLRSMLFTMASMDKKYREKLPGIIKDLNHGSLSDLEDGLASAKNKRKSRKPPKLTRDGMYSSEEDYVKRWWLSDVSRRQEESTEQLMRRRMGDLRVRETLQQVILILEILSLEETLEFKAAVAAESNTQQELLKDGDIEAKKKRKPKKSMDLTTTLDLLMDKLSIWQTIEGDSAAGTSDISTRDNNGKLQDRDLLASFCIEVVIPFYKSRSPRQAAEVNKRFGGPGAVSPEKFRKPKQREKVQEQNPEKNSKKRPRQLQKTPSESYTQSKRHRPSLARSATDSATLQVKREASEISLRDISPARPATRGTSVQLKHLQQRQIDMGAITAAAQAKLKQKARIEEELQGAIDTLKKPNRGAAVKEYVQSTERRSLGSASMRKKTAGPIRKILQNVPNVQVTATPRHVRKTDAFVPVTVHNCRHDQYNEQPPSSSDFCVLSTGYRPCTSRRTANNQPLFQQAPPDTGNSITETPSRGPSKLLSFADLNPQSQVPMSTSSHLGQQGESSTIEATPSRGSAQQLHFPSISSRLADDSIPKTPSKPHQTLSKLQLDGEKTRAPIFATPQKPRLDKLQTAPAALPQTPEASLCKITALPKVSIDVDEGKDIYDALGWNDDYDEI